MIQTANITLNNIKLTDTCLSVKHGTTVDKSNIHEHPYGEGQKEATTLPINFKSQS